MDPLRQIVAKFSLVLAAPATAPVPKCNDPALSFGSISVAQREGDMLPGQYLVLHTILPRLEPTLRLTLERLMRQRLPLTHRQQCSRVADG